MYSGVQRNPTTASIGFPMLSNNSERILFVCSIVLLLCSTVAHGCKSTLCFSTDSVGVQLFSRFRKEFYWPSKISIVLVFGCFSVIRRFLPNRSGRLSGLLLQSLAS